MGQGQGRECGTKNCGAALASAMKFSIGGVYLGGKIGWGKYWKEGMQYDEKSAKVSNMLIHVPDHDTYMSAMLCRLMYKFDGRMLKIKATTRAYQSLEDLRDKTSNPEHPPVDLRVNDQDAVILGAGDMDMEQKEVDAACATLTTCAGKGTKEITVSDIKDWHCGDFLMIRHPSTGNILSFLSNRSERVRIMTVDTKTKVIHLASSLKYGHAATTKVYKIRKYVEILYQQTRYYVEFEPEEFEMVSGSKVDIRSFVKTELSGDSKIRRSWIRRAIFHPGGALSPSFCTVIADDGHEGALYPVTMWIAWQGSMFDKRPIDAFTDLGGAPVKAELWYKQYPDLWVHSAMYAKMQSDALGQTDVFLELVQAYDVKRVVFCGHSLGGGIARIAHVYALAKFHEMAPDEKKLVEGLHVQSITWAAPMVLFEQEVPETGRRLVPLEIKDKEGHKVEKKVPMTMDGLRWKKESEALVGIRNQRKQPQSRDIQKETINEWNDDHYEKSVEAENNMLQLKKTLLETSVNHIFHKDIVPQLPGNHQFFQPAIAMAAQSIVQQYCPVWEEELKNVVNDLSSQAFADGALANNFKELERFSHLCEVKAYFPPDVDCTKDHQDLPQWKEEKDDTYQYLLTCHTFFPNNVQGSSTLTRSTTANDVVIHVASTHDWHNHDCLLIRSQTSEEEVQIEKIEDFKITLTKPLKCDYAVEAEVRREPRRIVDEDGNWGTYVGSLDRGHASGEGSLHYDATCGDKTLAGKLFVGKFNIKGHICTGLILDDGTPKSTVEKGKVTDQYDQVIADKYKEKSDTAKAVEKERMRLRAEMKELKTLNAMDLSQVIEEGSRMELKQKQMQDAAWAANLNGGDSKQAIVDLILQRKFQATTEIANSTA